MSDLIERLRNPAWEDHSGQSLVLSPEPTTTMMREAADEIERLRKLLEWQPIETAPMDGTVILVFENIRGGPGDGLGIARYEAGMDLPWRGLYDDGAQVFRPRHWRPLPAPPNI